MFTPSMPRLTAEPGSEDASRLDLLRFMGTQSFASAD
jgi:hypothetical protein